MKTILIICSANICRSPMAAAILRQRIADIGLGEQVAVRSAGIWAREGLPASRDAVLTLAERGITLGAHRSQPVTADLLEQASILLVMEEAHRRSLFYLAPRLLNKAFLLAEMAGGHDDVADPYGGSSQEYVETAGLLTRLIDAGLPNILKLIGVSTGAAEHPAPQ